MTPVYHIDQGDRRVLWVKEKAEALRLLDRYLIVALLLRLWTMYGPRGSQDSVKARKMGGTEIQLVAVPQAPGAPAGRERRAPGGDRAPQPVHGESLSA